MSAAPTSGLSVTVATFNCEWRKSSSADGKLIVERLFELEPDVICLTECHADYLKDEGYVICSEPCDPLRPTRRKVLLWSRAPWSDENLAATSRLPPSRFIQGTTRTTLGLLTFAGVVIPYRMAEVRARGRKPWELHYEYLDGLGAILPTEPRSMVMLGDFNQRFPRRFQPIAVHQALERRLRDRLVVITGGVVEPIGRQAIDHISVSEDLTGLRTASVSNVDPSGRDISDHFGVCATIGRSPSPLAQ